MATATSSNPPEATRPAAPLWFRLLGVAILTILVLVAARLMLSATSSTAPVDLGTWNAESTCEVPLCLLSPDSFRYGGVTQYFVTIGPLSDDPLAMLSAGTDYQGSFLGGSKNGVSYSYVSSLLATGLDLSPYAANSVLSFLSAIGLALLLAVWFERRRLPRVWLYATIASPISTYYGNQAIKETWSVLLLVTLVLVGDRFAARQLRRPKLAIIAVVTASVLLYFDREYYLFIALAVNVWLVIASFGSRGVKIGASAVASAVLVTLVVVRASHTVSPLSSYYARYSVGGFGFGSPNDLLVGVPRTLLAPIGGLDDPGQALLLVLSFPVFFAYVACLSLALQGRRRPSEASNLGFRDPRILAFFAMVVLWTVTYGGGFERGRDAIAPLLFMGLARWQGDRAAAPGGPRPAAATASAFRRRS